MKTINLDDYKDFDILSSWYELTKQFEMLEGRLRLEGFSEDDYLDLTTHEMVDLLYNHLKEQHRKTPEGRETLRQHEEYMKVHYPEDS